MQMGRKAKDETHRYNHLKFTVEFNGIIPEKIKFYDQATDAADDIPLKEIINEMALSSKDIAVFDRGLKSRETFEEDLTAIDITDIYRLRWEIERFFRFIKQNLNFSHLISRDYNAIKNMAYVMLIAAMFIALYAKLNQRNGFKINKLKFLYELEAEIVKELIILCKGDLNLLNQYTPL
jgi:IS4 transposase